jgi:hypothetical protein
MVDPAAWDRRSRQWKLWERGAPMEWWQMDVVGGFRLADGTCAKALTGIDDHSRLRRPRRVEESLLHRKDGRFGFRIPDHATAWFRWLCSGGLIGIFRRRRCTRGFVRVHLDDRLSVYVSPATTGGGGSSPSSA